MLIGNVQINFGVSRHFELTFFARDSVCCKRAYAIAIPSLQLGTGKTAVVRLSGWLVGKSCLSRVCLSAL